MEPRRATGRETHGTRPAPRFFRRRRAQAPAAEPGCHLHVVRDLQTLDGWKERWDELAGRCGPDGFFCRYAFVEAFWRRHRLDRGKKLHVLLIEQGGRLRLAMPLILKQGWAGTSILRPLDSRTPLYDDALIDPGFDLDTAAAMLGRHLESTRWCRALKFGFVREGSSLAGLLGRLGATTGTRETTFALDLAPFSGWDDFIASRKAEAGRYRLRMMRRLGEIGHVELQRIADAGSMSEDIAWIFARKREWVLRRTGAANWISPPETESCFQEAAAKLSRTGEAFTMRLSCGGRRIAAMLLWRNADRLFLSKIAYDPAWSKYSPGWLLTLESVRLGFSEGVGRIDLMIGRDQWKDRLASEALAVRSYRLGLPPFDLPRLDLPLIRFFRHPRRTRSIAGEHRS